MHAVLPLFPVCGFPIPLHAVFVRRHSRMSSSHSLHGCPFLELLSIIQYTTFLISRPSPIRELCPNIFHYNLHYSPFVAVRLLASTFVIFCCQRVCRIHRQHFISNANNLGSPCFSSFGSHNLLAYAERMC